MNETQHNADAEPENDQQSSGAAPLSGKNSAKRNLAVIFGLLQLAWLGWLAFVAWKVLSS